MDGLGICILLLIVCERFKRFQPDDGRGFVYISHQ